MNKIKGYTVKVAYRRFKFDNADDAMGFAQAAAQAIAEVESIEIFVDYELEEGAEADE